MIKKRKRRKKALRVMPAEHTLSTTCSLGMCGQTIWYKGAPQSIAELTIEFIKRVFRRRTK